MPSQLFSFSGTGTAGDDFLLGGTGVNVISGGDGDDYILGDSGGAYFTGTSNSQPAPANIDGEIIVWNSDENPFFGNATVPRTSLYVLADAGQSHYSSVTVGAGERITIDIDFGFDHPIGGSTDVFVELYDSNGVKVAFNDDGTVEDGAGGSVSNFDSFLSFTNTTGVAQLYTIRFREFGDSDLGVFEGGETFVANISVSGHATHTATAMGNDTLNGGSGHDTLAGQAGNDILNGEIGDDSLLGGSGNDTLDGGDGLDTADYAGSAASVAIDLRIVGAQNTLGAGADVLVSIENAVGSDFNDTLTGNDFNNVLSGQGGDDSLIGGAGDDSLIGGTGSDTANYSATAAGVTVMLGTSASQNTVGAGLDTLISIENVIGTDFNDTLLGSIATNSLSGGNGNDVLNSGGSDDFLFGEAGNDILTGGPGHDLINGGAGFDSASYAASGFAVIVDLSQSEQHTFGAGIDTLVSIEDVEGSAFNDTLTGSAGVNAITGLGGDDTITGGNGNDYLGGGDGSDTLIGGSGSDNLDGGTGDNILLGGDGHDLLVAGAGNDKLSGASGNDILYDLGGDDLSDGGTGTDIVYYLAAAAGVSINLNIRTTQNTGGGGFDTLTGIENLGGSGFNDTFVGDGAVNLLSGGAGNDTLYGAAGNDTLIGDSGDDALDGGDGNDTASYASAAGAVSVDLRTLVTQDTLAGGLDSLLFIEILIGSTFADTLIGNSGVNTLLGGADNDSLSGGDANDTLFGEAGDDALDGGAGNDTASFLTATAGVVVSLALAGAQNTIGAGTDTFVSIERLVGSRFADTLIGNGAANVLTGGGANDDVDGAAGDDLLYGGTGNDRLIGGTGNDTLTGDSGEDTASYADSSGGIAVSLAVAGAQNTGAGGIDTLVSIERLTGSAFNDTLIGNTSINVLSGEVGNDFIDAGAGDDSLLGGTGDDMLIGGAGNDSVNGGSGNDTAAYGASASAVTVSLAIAGAQDTGGAGIDTLISIERVTGTAFADTLTGNAIANLLGGGGGNDVLIGGAGNDSLSGDAGDDLLVGGAGNDGMIGDSGADLFRFDSALSAATNVDTISGYSVADDTMQLSQTIFTAAGPLGTLSAAAFRIGAVAGDASDRIIYDGATGQLFYDADGTGGGAQILFAQVAAGLALTNADFSVVG